jgi:hypothetical protein
MVVFSAHGSNRDITRLVILSECAVTCFFCWVQDSIPFGVASLRRMTIHI